MTEEELARLGNQYISQLAQALPEAVFILVITVKDVPQTIVANITNARSVKELLDCAVQAFEEGSAEEANLQDN